MCLAQDPCPNSPWQFNPYENYVIADVQGCRVIAYYEEADCPGPYKKFRLKFIQLGPNNGGIRTGVFITSVIRHILYEIISNNEEFYDLVTYQCWTRVTGYNYTRISPCLTNDECCLIEYQVVDTTLLAINLVYQPNTECPINCYPECDTLADPNLIPLGRLPRVAVDEPEPNPVKPSNLLVSFNETKDWCEVIFEGLEPENVILEVYNLIGAKVYQSIPTKRLTNSSHFTIPKLTQGLFILVLRKNGEILFRELKVFIK